MKLPAASGRGIKNHNKYGIDFSWWRNQIKVGSDLFEILVFYIWQLFLPVIC